jgi:hypothetical protein
MVTNAHTGPGPGGVTPLTTRGGLFNNSCHVGLWMRHKTRSRAENGVGARAMARGHMANHMTEKGAARPDLGAAPNY